MLARLLYAAGVDAAQGLTAVVRWGLLAVLVLAMIGLWVIVATGYAELPAQVPVHFNFAGDPDRWGSKTELLVLAGVGSGMALVVSALSWWMGSLAIRRPAWINMPDNSWRTLPPELRAWVMVPMCLSMQCLGLVLLGVFAFIYVGSVAVARGSAATLASWPLFCMVGVSLGVVLLGLFNSTRRIRLARQTGLG